MSSRQSNSRIAALESSKPATNKKDDEEIKEEEEENLNSSMSIKELEEVEKNEKIKKEFLVYIEPNFPDDLKSRNESQMKDSITLEKDMIGDYLSPERIKIIQIKDIRNMEITKIHSKSENKTLFYYKFRGMLQRVEGEEGERSSMILWSIDSDNNRKYYMLQTVYLNESLVKELNAENGKIKIRIPGTEYDYIEISDGAFAFFGELYAIGQNIINLYKKNEQFFDLYNGILKNLDLRHLYCYILEKKHLLQIKNIKKEDLLNYCDEFMNDILIKKIVQSLSNEGEESNLRQLSFDMYKIQAFLNKKIEALNKKIDEIDDSDESTKLMGENLKKSKIVTKSETLIDLFRKYFNFIAHPSEEEEEIGLEEETPQEKYEKALYFLLRIMNKFFKNEFPFCCGESKKEGLNYFTRPYLICYDCNMIVCKKCFKTHQNHKYFDISTLLKRKIYNIHSDYGSFINNLQDIEKYIIENSVEDELILLIYKYAKIDSFQDSILTGKGLTEDAPYNIFSFLDFIIFEGLCKKILPYYRNEKLLDLDLEEAKNKNYPLGLKNCLNIIDGEIQARDIFNTYLTSSVELTDNDKADNLINIIQMIKSKEDKNKMKKSSLIGNATGVAKDKDEQKEIEDDIKKETDIKKLDNDLDLEKNSNAFNKIRDNILKSNLDIASKAKKPIDTLMLTKEIEDNPELHKFIDTVCNLDCSGRKIFWYYAYRDKRNKKFETKYIDGFGGFMEFVFYFLYQFFSKMNDSIEYVLTFDENLFGIFEIKEEVEEEEIH